MSQPGGGETASSRMVREWKDIKCSPQNSSYSTAQGLEVLFGSKQEGTAAYGELPDAKWNFSSRV